MPQPQSEQTLSKQPQSEQKLPFPSFTSDEMPAFDAFNRVDSQNGDSGHQSLGRGAAGDVKTVFICCIDGEKKIAAGKTSHHSDSTRNTREIQIIKLIHSAAGCFNSIESGLLVQHAREDKIFSPICEGSLAQHLPTLQVIAQKNSKLYKILLMDFLDSMLRALNTLQNAQIIHRDIKPGNILLRIKPNPNPIESQKIFDAGFVLIDLGSAVIVGETYKLVDGTTLQYAAPEEGFQQFMSSPDAQATEETFSQDIYSLGQVLKHCLSNQEILTAIAMRQNETEARYFSQVMRYIDAINSRKANATPPIEEPTTSHNFISALDALATTMTALLPDHRPDLNKLQRSAMELKNLLRTECPDCFDDETDELQNETRLDAYMRLANPDLFAEETSTPPERKSSSSSLFLTHHSNTMVFTETEEDFPPSTAETRPSV